MGIAMHKVLPENAREYTACHIACWQAAYRGMIPEDYLANMSSEIQPRTERLLKTLDEPGDWQFYYAAIEGKMAGRLIIGESRDEDKPEAGEICALYLLEEYWDRGYGRQMMDFAVDALETMGFGEIILWVLEENVRARRFYEKCGFVFDGTRKEIEIGKILMEVRYALVLNE